MKMHVTFERSWEAVSNMNGVGLAVTMDLYPENY